MENINLQAYLTIRTIIQENNLTYSEAISLISDNTCQNLGAFMQLRKVMTDNKLTPQQTQELIKKAMESLQQQNVLEKHQSIPIDEKKTENDEGIEK